MSPSSKSSTPAPLSTTTVRSGSYRRASGNLDMASRSIKNEIAKVRHLQAQLDEKLRRLEERAEERISHYEDDELSIDMVVVAKSGRGHSAKWVKCRIIDIADWRLSHDKAYKLQRLDSGRAYRTKNADELYPIEILQHLTEGTEEKEDSGSEED